jgi:hypothetical protein
MADARKRVAKIVRRDNIQLAIKLVAAKLMHRQILTGQDIKVITACIVGRRPSMRTFKAALDAKKGVQSDRPRKK